MTDRLANAQERAIKMLDTVFIQCYKEGFDDGYKDGTQNPSSVGFDHGYERGLNDAWECARKIASMPTDVTEPLFNQFGLHNIMANVSPFEAIAKIKKYEENEQKIKVGDIVTVGGGTEEFIVTWVGGKPTDEVTLISRSGFHARCSRIDCLIKTGEHCDIEKCFKCKVF